MARRNDHTREELIRITLDTVKTFLNDSSYHELSLRKIATAIGYVPSTLVNIFGNYNLLLLHVVGETLDELYQQANSALADISDPHQALHELAYCYHDFAKNNMYRWQLIFEHNMNGDELPHWQEERISRMMSMLECLLKQLSAQRNDMEVINASRVLWSSVHGITMFSVDDKFFASKPIVGKELIDNLLSNYLQNW